MISTVAQVVRRCSVCFLISCGWLGRAVVWSWEVFLEVGVQITRLQTTFGLEIVKNGGDSVGAQVSEVFQLNLRP